MAVTAIRSIANRLGADEVYNVRNLENPSDTGGRGREIQVGHDQRVQCNMWIPWCVTEVDFANYRHKIIVVPMAAGQFVNHFAIWQQDDYVRYSRNGVWRDDGDLVPGNCTVGGDRSVEIVGPDLQHADLLFY